MNKNTARTVSKHGLDLCRRAYALSRDGEGCSTIGIYLGVHWKTADGLVNAGRELASIVLRMPLAHQGTVGATHPIPSGVQIPRGLI